MVMSKKKFTYNKKSRNDISNPHHCSSHSELLRSANVKTYNGNYEINKLDNGRIMVHTLKK